MSAIRLPDDLPPDGWIPLENRFYCRHTVYDSLLWDITPEHLANALIAVAPNAGPIALVPAGWALPFALATYSLSGRLVARFDRLREQAASPFRPIALGWSSDDLLTIVYNDGILVRVPAGMHVSRARTIRLFHRDTLHHVYDADVLPTGDVVIRSSLGRLFRVDASDKIRTDFAQVTPPDAVLPNVPNAVIAAVRPDRTPNGLIDTLLVSDVGKLTLVNSTSPPFTLDCTRHDVALVAISQNSQYVAALESESAVLFVHTIDLRSQIACVDLAKGLVRLGVENVLSDDVFSAKTPEALSWVGSDAIAVLYREHLVLVGPHGGIAVLPLDPSFIQSGVALQPENDGLRLISSTAVQFVQMVPEPINTVICQKLSPGYKLLRSSVADDVPNEITSSHALTRYRLLRELRESASLLEAARSCVAASYLELDVELQKALLRAAAYGMRYATVFAGEEPRPSTASTESPPTGLPPTGRSAVSRKRYDERTKRDIRMVPTAIAVLRVLNAVATPEAGIPLTKPQFDALGLSRLVARLSCYGEHTLALRLASYGGIGPYDVLSEWATALIRSNPRERDDVLTALIAEKFDAISRSYHATDVHGSHRSRALPFVTAAEAAYAFGRPKCAELLLRRETRPAPKVAMYLKMDRDGPAVIAAVASGDPELVLDALGTIMERKTVRETARLLRTLPTALGNRATDLLATHLRQIGDFNALRWVFVENHRYREAALVDIHQASIIEDAQEHISSLEAATVNISRGQGRKSCYFELQALQHATSVANCSLELERKSRLEPGSLRYANDGDLLARAIFSISDAGRRGDMLQKLQRDLRVPDRRYYWVCLQSMAEAGEFKAIEMLSNSAGINKLPPIGLIAFVETCIKYQMEDEAVKYALRIPDLRDRARALARCGRGREAADIASRLRNQQLLAEVQDLTARHVSYISIPLSRTENKPQS